jgi:hypothetical protein
VVDVILQYICVCFDRNDFIALWGLKIVDIDDITLANISSLTINNFKFCDTRISMFTQSTSFINKNDA